MTTELSQLLPVKVVAERFSLPLTTVYKLIREGVIPAVHFNPRTIRIDPIDVQAWLMAQKELVKSRV